MSQLTRDISHSFPKAITRKAATGILKMDVRKQRSLRIDLTQQEVSIRCFSELSEMLFNGRLPLPVGPFVSFQDPGTFLRCVGALSPARLRAVRHRAAAGGHGPRPGKATEGERSARLRTPHAPAPRGLRGPACSRTDGRRRGTDPGTRGQAGRGERCGGRRAGGAGLGRTEPGRDRRTGAGGQEACREGEETDAGGGSGGSARAAGPSRSGPRAREPSRRAARARSRRAPSRPVPSPAPRPHRSRRLSRRPRLPRRLGPRSGGRSAGPAPGAGPVPEGSRRSEAANKGPAPAAELRARPAPAASGRARAVGEPLAHLVKHGRAPDDAGRAVGPGPGRLVPPLGDAK